MSWRLFAVIILTLAMGLVFGGLRVAAATNSAAQFNRVSQLANLGQQVTGLIQALENERDRRCGSVRDPGALQSWYHATDVAGAKVQALAADVGGSFPADIQAKVAATRTAITNLGHLRDVAQPCTSALAVIADYAVPINGMMALNGQIAQGANDPALANDVQTLSALSQEKDQVTQQRAILFDAFNHGKFANAEQQALFTVVAGQSADETAFNATATPAEQSAFTRVVTGPKVTRAIDIEQYVVNTGNLDLSTGAGALGISGQEAPGTWYSAVSGTIDKMQAVELGIAGNIVARAQVLQRGAERSALFIGILTAAILILVLIATFAVARSLVLPLRRLQEGALDIATVQLPERVRQFAEDPDPAASLEVSPIDVLSVDEIGQVARAFDQVHAEAVRLAGTEALLRRSFNAVFVSLSRRSQSLIERLARMIDSLEQNEEDPGRLASLFAMDHMVTRMRRNSENLLLLAGHEGARKWSEPVPLTDVTRAAISEIEQYNRVALKIQPGVMVSGHAVSDVVHLLAELIENATVFSSSDNRVLVSVQELTSGGVLIQVSDNGVGISPARLEEINRRLDDPPAIDDSVSRHMGLFAVARLAQRHGIRVRLRAGSPQGLTALVWLPDSLAERGNISYGDMPQRFGGPQARHTPGQHAAPGPAREYAAPSPPPAAPLPARETVPRETVPRETVPRETVPAAGPAASWFRNRQPAEGGPPAAGPMPATDGWAGGLQAAQIIANPVRGDRTVAGMPVRVPHANLLPGSVGGAQRTAGRAADGQEAQPRTTLPQRSPELARSRLSGFQRGARRAEGQTPHAGERADR